MNQKSIIVVLGVVVIILIGTTVYFATLNKASQPVAPAPVAQTPAQPVTTQPASNNNMQEQSSLINNRIDVRNGNDKNGKIESYNFSYPLGWDMVDFGMTYGQQSISLIKKLSADNKNYLCVDFGFRTADFYKHFKDPDERKLTGGLTMKDFGKGYSFYSWKNNSAGYLIDKDVKNVATLANNVKLQVSVMFNCIQSDTDNLTLNYDQQVSSKEYQEAINIIESLVKSLK
jgi:hypothetical protein